MRRQSGGTTALLLCISKPGGTIETVGQHPILRDWLTRNLGAEETRRRPWVITDPEHGWLRQMVRTEGPASPPVSPQVGGRCSVLSAVGLPPLAALGVDVDAL